MRTLIVDYGVCNLGSMSRALEECYGAPFISTNPEDIAHATHIILPGVGHFSDATKTLEQRGWGDALRHAALQQQKPLLGVCLGMQLLLSHSEEGDGDGLKLMDGQVKKIPAKEGLRVPHMGWNEVHYSTPCLLLDQIEAGTDFYFVHSYHAVPAAKEHAIAQVEYGQQYAAIIGHKNIMGTQFHPEKSGFPGLQLLKNFLNHYA
jgi:glutamine amidotransferase